MRCSLLRPKWRTTDRVWVRHRRTGNKRTASLVSQMFLEADGYEAPVMPVIEAISITQAEAAGVPGSQMTPPCPCLTR